MPMSLPRFQIKTGDCVGFGVVVEGADAFIEGTPVSVDMARPSPEVDDSFVADGSLQRTKSGGHTSGAESEEFTTWLREIIRWAPEKVEQLIDHGFSLASNGAGHEATKITQFSFRGAERYLLKRERERIAQDAAIALVQHVRHYDGYNWLKQGRGKLEFEMKRKIVDLVRVKKLHYIRAVSDEVNDHPGNDTRDAFLQTRIDDAGITRRTDVVSMSDVVRILSLLPSGKPSHQREIVQLYCLEELPLSEIAERLGFNSAPAARYHFQLALKELRKLLDWQR